MKRRQFVQGLGAAGVATGLAACERGEQGSTAVSNQRFNWKIVTTWPPNFPIFHEGVERFTKEVAKMSNNRLRITVFAGGELIPALQSFDAVSQGTVEMGHGAAYYWAGKIPASQFFTAVPFGLNAQGMNAWMYYGGGRELWREIYEPFNLTPLPMGNTGVQMGGWFRKKIESITDLKGLKMRIPGLGGKVMAKAGANPVLLSGGEIYTSLERGNIDATEWVGPYHDLRLGLHRAAEYYYYPGWHEPGPTLELLINTQAWQQLPEDLQLIVENAAAASNLWMLAEFEAKNLAALKTLREEHNVNILPFPDDVIASLKQLTEESLNEEADKDPTFAKVLSAYRAFAADNAQWSALSEAAYAKTLS